MIVASDWVDLHCHSTASDGTLAPAAVVQLARESGLSGLALTDHDTAAGVAEASAEAERLGLSFIPGIEISCTYPHPGTMHLLGYGIDVNRPALRRMSESLIGARDERNPQIVKKLNDLGVAITMEEVERQAGGQVVGRPHIAAVLLKKGYVSSIKNAFDKYLAQGAPAFVDKERMTSKQAIGLILESGGVPVLAHPIQLRTENDAQLERVVRDLIDLGLMGIEVIHSDHDEALVAKYSALADRFKLIKTGGSDFHGTNKKDIQLGVARGRRVPRAFFDALAARIDERRAASAG